MDPYLGMGILLAIVTLITYFAGRGSSEGEKQFKSFAIPSWISYALIGIIYVTCVL